MCTWMKIYGNLWKNRIAAFIAKVNYEQRRSITWVDVWCKIMEIHVCKIENKCVNRNIYTYKLGIFTIIFRITLQCHKRTFFVFVLNIYSRILRLSWSACVNENMLLFKKLICDNPAPIFVICFFIMLCFTSIKQSINLQILITDIVQLFLMYFKPHWIMVLLHLRLYQW